MWRLANLCIQYDGYAVFSARTLYNLLHEDMMTFSSECDTNENDTSSRAANQYFTRPFELLNIGDVQQYNLLPNPNNGNFSISQLLADEAPVKTEIWNALGAKIYGGKLDFRNKKAAIKLNDIPPGSYLLKLNDSKGNCYTIKFTVL
ncbi:MAG TPA: T9SS type A sorting domain-containing protein [Flavipsychrobacter sp.]|nr:T9SS type A sorting domain-containing protein [Flavipsychrobacter sp.]